MPSSMKNPIPMASLTASFSSTSSLEDDSSLETDFVETPFLEQADVYGQVHPIESRGLLEQRLSEFDEHLGRVLCDGTALNAALENFPTLFCQESFRLLFLRAECFRVKDAVQRFDRYWERRIEVFGKKAFHPITLDSLDDDSRTFLNRGAIRWIRRTNDRDILFFDPSQLDPKAYERLAAVQAVWFILQELIEADVRVQQKGVICIGYPRHFSSRNRDPGLTKQCLKFLQSALPIRITAVHCTTIPMLYYFVLSFILCFVDERLRKRLIVHADIAEVQLAERLEDRYGIEQSATPIELGGRLNLKSHGWCVDATAVTNDDCKLELPKIESVQVSTEHYRRRGRKLWKLCK